MLVGTPSDEHLRNVSGSTLIYSSLKDNMVIKTGKATQEHVHNKPNYLEAAAAPRKIEHETNDISINDMIYKSIKVSGF